jgi:hypothetical protein
VLQHQVAALLWVQAQVVSLVSVVLSASKLVFPQMARVVEFRY